MIFLFIALAVGAAFACAGTPLFVVAVVNAVASVWGNGVIANFRTDPHNMPNYAVTVSIVTTVAAVALLIAGLVVR
jgi:hypothetical protein